jgi:AcrR family transcriptional regulator
MVQKYRDSKSGETASAEDAAVEKKPRGRPRAYDAEHALRSATETFWRSGYAGTSLDELSDATGMNRPSLYGAFGDKQALYLATLDRYVDISAQVMQKKLDVVPLTLALQRVCEAALEMYYPSADTQRGCFLIGTAAVEAVRDDQVRKRLGDGLRTFDKIFEARFLCAQQEGELAAEADPVMLAKLASALLHSLAVRARAGDSRATLRATALAGIKLLCR